MLQSQAKISRARLSSASQGQRLRSKRWPTLRKANLSQTTLRQAKHGKVAGARSPNPGPNLGWASLASGGLSLRFWRWPRLAELSLALPTLAWACTSGMGSSLAERAAIAELAAAALLSAAQA